MWRMLFSFSCGGACRTPCARRKRVSWRSSTPEAKFNRGALEAPEALGAGKATTGAEDKAITAVDEAQSPFKGLGSHVGRGGGRGVGCESFCALFRWLFATWRSKRGRDGHEMQRISRKLIFLHRISYIMHKFHVEFHRIPCRVYISSALEACELQSRLERLSTKRTRDGGINLRSAALLYPW